MKTKQIANNKYQIINGSLQAVVLLTARNGNWYFRPQGGTKKIATRTTDKEVALTIAANHFFEPQIEEEQTGQSEVTIGQLWDLYSKATERGEIENRNGKPITLAHSLNIKRAAQKICGKDLKKFPLAAFGLKISGLSAPIAKYKSTLFQSGSKALIQGAEYQKAAETYNSTLRNFKCLFKNALNESVYADLKLCTLAVACIKSASPRNVERKPFKGIDPAILDKIDAHYSDIENLGFNPKRRSRGKVRWNNWVRYWIARCTGLRKDEIINSRHDWLIYEKGRWWINVSHTKRYRDEEKNIWVNEWSSKSSKSRLVPIPEFLVKAIQAQKTNDHIDEPIMHLSSFTTNHLSNDESYRKEWRRAFEKAGGDYNEIKKPTHQLRGEFITDIIAKTQGVATAQAYAGHSNPLTTTNHYCDSSRIAKVVEINPLGR